MEEIKKIPQRSELAEKDTWAISDIYPTDEAWEQDLENFKALTQKQAAFAGRISASAKELLYYLQGTEEAATLGENLANYAMRKNDEDTRVSKYQDMTGRFMSAYVAFNAATSFETPELLSISDETMEQFYAEAPELTVYRRYLNDIRRRKEHVLSPAEEKLLAEIRDLLKEK